MLGGDERTNASGSYAARCPCAAHKNGARSIDAPSAGRLNSTAPDAHAVSVLLAARIDELARVLLPQGKAVSGSWRVGGLDGATGGLLAIALTGSKRRLWIDHATGEKGDALDLVKGVRHYKMREAIEWSKKWLDRGTRRARPPSAGGRR